MKRVLVIAEYMLRYRAPFFEKLHDALAQREIALQVAYSDPPPGNGVAPSNVTDLPSQYGVRVNAYRALGHRLLFQSVLKQVMSADLVIVEQASRFVLNPLLLQASRLNLKRVAYWGHGRALQENPNPLSEWFKRKTLNSVDWWFAHTRSTAEYLQHNGVPREKITTVENSIDTTQLRTHLTGIGECELDQERANLEIPRDARVAIFCGRFYVRKDIPLLTEAAHLIKRRIPEFHLVLIGDGASTNGNGNGVNGSRRDRWIHYTGPRFDRDKARLLKLAEVFLLPGAVGLAILDAFTASLPLVTTTIPHHGPEIEYIEPGVNGLMTPPSAHEYAEGVVGLLTNPSLLSAMRAAAEETSRKYTIEKMIANFVHGIEGCLSTTA